MYKESKKQAIMTKYCSLCEREVPKKHQEHHHLTPVSKKGRKSERIMVCHDCGNQIHTLFSNRQLADTYNTLEKLKSNEHMQKWIKWISTKSVFSSVCMKKKKGR